MLMFVSRSQNQVCEQCSHNSVSTKKFVMQFIWRNYYQKFIFYFAKPINEILDGTQKVPHVILFKDYSRWDNQEESLKRYYTKNEVQARIKVLTDFHIANFQPPQPNLCTLVQYKILQKRTINLYYQFYNNASKTEQTQKQKCRQSNILTTEYTNSVRRSESFQTDEHNIYSDLSQDYSVKSKRYAPLFRDLEIIKNLQDINSSQTGWDSNLRNFDEVIDNYESKLSLLLQKQIRNQSTLITLPKLIFKIKDWQKIYLDATIPEQNQILQSVNSEFKPAEGSHLSRTHSYKIKNLSIQQDKQRAFQFNQQTIIKQSEKNKPFQEVYLRTPSQVKKQHSRIINTSFKPMYPADLGSFSTQVVREQLKTNIFRKVSVSGQANNSTTAKTDRNSLISPTEEIIQKIKKQQELNHTYGSKTKQFYKYSGLYQTKDKTSDFPTFQTTGSMTTRLFNDVRVKTDHHSSVTSVNEKVNRGSDAQLLFNNGAKKSKVQQIYLKQKPDIKSLSKQTTARQIQIKNFKDHQIYLNDKYLK